MISHQDPSMNSNVEFIGILLQPCEIGFHITITSKNHLPVVTPLNNMLWHTTSETLGIIGIRMTWLMSFN
jgi:hypothetical protein